MTRIGSVTGDASQQPVLQEAPQATHPHQEGVPVQIPQQPAISPAQAMRTDAQFGQPLAPAPDPNKPMMTPHEAQMQPSSTVATPSQAEQEPEATVAIDQAIRGFMQTYSRWEEVDEAHKAIKESIEQKRRLPLIQFPVSARSGSGESVMFELDLDQIIPTGLSEEERGAFLLEQFKAWNNYLVAEWKRLWLKMFFFLGQGCHSIDPEYLQQQAEQALAQDPARLVNLASRVASQQQPQPQSQP